MEHVQRDIQLINEIDIANSQQYVSSLWSSL